MDKVQKSRKKISLKKYLTVLLPLLVISFIAIFIVKLPDNYVLSKRGIEVEGIITKFNSENGRTSYEYSFDGNTYQDEFTYKGSNPADVNWKVTLDPESPRRNCLGDAAKKFYDSVKITIFLTVGIIIISFIRILHASASNPFGKSDEEFKGKREEYKKNDALNK